jgi:phenylpyruvate tautomerase PptA (4-oxalocrotonate tautomerase family)
MAHPEIPRILCLTFWIMVVIILPLDDDRHSEGIHLSRSTPMPMIDVYAPADLFPAGSERALGEALTLAVLRAEGVATPGPFHTHNTAAYLHRMDPATVQTAATAQARTVRIQVITPPGSLNRAGQKQIVKEATEIVAKLSNDPSQAGRTWVILQEAAEGGWGLAGTAFGVEEFTALAAKAKAAG